MERYDCWGPGGLGLGPPDLGPPVGLINSLKRVGLGNVKFLCPFLCCPQGIRAMEVT